MKKQNALDRSVYYARTVNGLCCNQEWLLCPSNLRNGSFFATWFVAMNSRKHFIGKSNNTTCGRVWIEIAPLGQDQTREPNHQGISARECWRDGGSTHIYADWVQEAVVWILYDSTQVTLWGICTFTSYTWKWITGFSTYFPLLNSSKYAKGTAVSKCGPWGPLFCMFSLFLLQHNCFKWSAH